MVSGSSAHTKVCKIKCCYVASSTQGHSSVSTKGHAIGCCTVCCMSPADAFLEVVVGVDNLSRAHSVVASMLLALNNNQLTNAFLGIDDKAEVSCWSLATKFGIHVHQVSHCHPIWNIHNALGLHDEIVSARHDFYSLPLSFGSCRCLWIGDTCTICHSHCGTLGL